MFKALQANEASRITAFMGGLQPILIFILAFIFLQEKLNWQSLIAFAIIILGTITISWQSDPDVKINKIIKKSYLLATMATILFAIFFTLSKYVFIHQNFISGFIWTRIGAFLGAIILLLWVRNRKDIIAEIKKPKKNTGSLFIVGQIAGALSFILINYAIAISESVALINVLQGTQYVFLLIIVIVLARKFPKFLKEKFTPKILTQKIVATVLIIFGLLLLFI